MNEPKTKTFIVLGNPRGGTSLIAGALIGLGVYMGDYTTPQYEDRKVQKYWSDPQGTKKFKQLIDIRNEDYRA